MSFAAELEKIRQDPSLYLTEACVLALGAYLFGYKATNMVANPTLTALAQWFEGPDAADACTRVYLLNRSTEVALREVLDALLAMLSESATPENRPGPGAHVTFVDFVREPILSGKTGMVLAEPTVTWLANFQRGYLAGLADVDASAAKHQCAVFETFELWLQRYYEHPHAPWHAIVRIHQGADLYGLRGFVTLWDQFENDTSKKTSE